MTLFRFFLLVVCALLFSSCGGGGDSNGGVADAGCGALNARVFGGEVCNQSARSPVVAIVPVGTDGGLLYRVGTCSGSLVTVDDIITSAHCFVEPVRAAKDAGITLIAFVAIVGGSGGEALLIRDLELHPLYRGEIGSQYDVAMATLEAIPSPPIGPLPLLVSESAQVGSNITAFGYGTNEQGIDDILKAGNFQITELLAGNLIVRGDGGSSICNGDSGGPAVYITSSGVSTLAGINSFGTATGCINNGSTLFGFVDLQNESTLSFITSYAPDAAVS